jgi:hypothetical protein
MIGAKLPLLAELPCQLDRGIAVLLWLLEHHPRQRLQLTEQSNL